LLGAKLRLATWFAGFGIVLFREEQVTVTSELEPRCRYYQDDANKWRPSEFGGDDIEQPEAICSVSPVK
jgi:hypothetical protein